MKPKITLGNINNFIEGTGRQIGAELGMTPLHIVEQAAWRESKCPECKTAGHCMGGCGCSVPGRWFTTRTCNKDKFPDLMNKEDWEVYKVTNNIKL